MEKGKCVVNCRRYKLEAPDGGWGYMICFAAVIINSTLSMFVGSFGIIYKDFIEEHKVASTTVTALSGMNLMVAALSAYISGLLLKIFSERQIALAMSLIFNAGNFGQIFVNSVPFFFLCQAAISVGAGSLYNISCTLTNEYFVKKRLLASSLAQAISAACAMIAPYLVKWTQDSIGYTGTLITIAGISMQTFVAVAMIQPVARHMVRVELEDAAEEIKLLPEKPPMENVVTTPTITVTDKDPFDVKISNETQDNKNRKKKKGISQILDTALLKKFLLSNASMGPTYCFFAEMVFCLMLPQALYALDWDKHQVAQAISLLSFGDLITRAMFVFTSKWLAKLGNQEVYLIAVAIAFVTRLLMLWSENPTAIMVFIAIMGTSRCAIFVLPPLILADIFPPEQFSMALGMFMMISGIVNLVLGPAVGAIRDMTNSYSTAFYVMTSCYAVVFLLWVIELVYKRSKHKRVIQRAAAEKIRAEKMKKNFKK